MASVDQIECDRVWVILVHKLARLLAFAPHFVNKGGGGTETEREREIGRERSRKEREEGEKGREKAGEARAILFGACAD